MTSLWAQAEMKKIGISSRTRNKVDTNRLLYFQQKKAIVGEKGDGSL
jgi:hypothetical protein